MLGPLVGPKKDSGTFSAEWLYSAAVALTAELVANKEPAVEAFAEKLRNLRPVQRQLGFKYRLLV